MSLTRRLAAAALAGAAAVTTAVVAAPPAQAMIKCGDNPINYCLMTIENVYLLPPPECMCELGFDLSLADRVVFDRVDVLLNRGAYDFRLAGRTTDRARKAALQQEGTSYVTQAMQLLSVAPRLKPQPDPWTQAAGGDYATGLQATFDSLRTRDSATAAALRARAATAFASFGAR
jgi:hypothetical protein